MFRKNGEGGPGGTDIAMHSIAWYCWIYLDTVHNFMKSKVSG